MSDSIALASPTCANIVESVRRVYERFPYPQYPLLAGLRWEDGYAGSSEFSARLFADLTGRIPAVHKQSHSRLTPSLRKILLAGGGEAQPYVLRKLEPANHKLICVELSRQSLLRARWRLLTTMKKTDFVRADLDQYLMEQGLVTGPYDHIDMYGILHHMPNPSRSLAAITERLSKDGTLRMMVYNSPARTWIHNIQAAFRDLRLDAFLLHDRICARRMLHALSHQSEAIRGKLQQMGESTIANDARLVDTFFHPREARLGPEFWFDLFNQLDLNVFAVFDRYGELDDLPNPLWQPPDRSELAMRAVTGAFENNLELYLSLGDLIAAKFSAKMYTPDSRRFTLPAFLQGPPKRWFSYEETAGISKQVQWKLWYAHLASVSRRKGRPLDSLVERLPIQSARRLARIGAIFPSQIVSKRLRERLTEPLAVASEQPAPKTTADLRSSPVSEVVLEIMQNKVIFSERRFSAVMMRLNRAQQTETHARL